MTTDSSVDSRFDISLPAYPYPGLRPFREDEWAIFFGRETIVEKVIDDLVMKRFVTMHGDSGSGKSSLVRAGVLPRLVQDLGRSGATWRTASMEPGNAPMRHLAIALAGLGEGGDDNAQTRFRRLLNLGRDAAPLLVSALRRGDSDHLCILVDQFEEIFAFAKDNNHAEAELFLEVLIGIQQQRLEGLHVILTMRSEYLGACARFIGLAETINDSQYLLPPMSRQALVRSICEPALLYGGQVTMDLVERLIADTGASQDQLPLIQHGLMVMERSLATAASPDQTGTDPSGATGWILSLDDYCQTKGVVDLLSDHADRILRDILKNQDNAGPVMEKVFRALTDIDADGHAIRRRQTVQQLADIGAVDATELAALLKPLRADGVSFLRPYGEEPLSARDEISISHEALIRCWKRIADPATGWLHKEFEEGLVWKTLLVAADGFAADKTAVLSATVTVERARWLSQRNATWATRYGGRFDDVRSLLEASEIALRRHKRNQYLLAVAIVGLVALGGYLVSSVRDRAALEMALAMAEEKQKELSIALSEVTAAQIAKQVALDEVQVEQSKNKELRSQLLAQKSVEATTAGDAGSGLAMALEMLREQPELPYIPEAERGVYAALFELRETSILDGHVQPLVSAAFDSSGQRILTASRDGSAKVWDTDTGNLLAELNGHDGSLNSAVWSEDDKRAVTSSFDGTVRIWDTTTGRLIMLLEGHGGSVYSAVFSPDGVHMLTASEDGTARLWDVESGLSTEVFEGHDSAVFSATFSADGDKVVTASRDATARIWDAKTGEALEVLRGHAAAVGFASFSTDGSQVLTNSQDGTARLWDALSGAILWATDEPKRNTIAGKGERGEVRVLSAIFSPDGRWFLTTSDDGTGKVLDASSGQTMRVLSGHFGTITTAAFSSDGEEILTGSDDGTLRLWNRRSGNTLFVLAGHEGPVQSVAFGPDDTRMVSASVDGTARIWSVKTALSAKRAGPSVVSGSVKGNIEQTGLYRSKSNSSEPTSISIIAISPDGERILRASETGQYGIWHPDDGEEMVADRLLEREGISVVAAGFAGTRDVAILSPNDSSLSSETTDRQTQPFEFLISNRRHHASSKTVGVPDSVAFASTRNRAALYFSGSATVELYDMNDSPTLVARVRITDDDPVVDVAGYQLVFDPSGEVVTGVSKSGDSVFTFHWPSVLLMSSLVLGDAPVLDVDVRQLHRSSGPGLQKILALHADRDSIYVVAVPTTRALEDLVIGDLLSDDPFQTVRPDPTERRPKSAAFDTDGRRIVFVSEQGVSLYSRDEEGMIGRFAMSGKQPAAASIAADGTAIAATSADGTIGYWPIFPSTGELEAFATKVAPRQLTPKQVETYLTTSQSTVYRR